MDQKNGIAMTICFRVGNTDVEVDPFDSTLTDPDKYQHDCTNAKFDKAAASNFDTTRYEDEVICLFERLLGKFCGFGKPTKGTKRKSPG